MRRGELWTVAGGGDFIGKPRPVVIVQSDIFDDLDSVAVCPFTSDLRDFPAFRLQVEPSAQNGLDVTSHIMDDKIIAVPKSRLGVLIGMLDDDDMRRLGQALILLLDLATSLDAE